MLQGHVTEEARALLDTELTELLDELSSELEGLEPELNALEVPEEDTTEIEQETRQEGATKPKAKKVLVRRNGKLVMVKKEPTIDPKPARIAKEADPEPVVKKKAPVERKASNTVKPADESDIITVKQLASELGLEGRLLRKKLRKKYARTDGRWEWSKSDPILTEIRSIFKN